MRLIDADDFKEFLQALCKAGAPYEEVVELLDEHPTAFDTEKVVEQLEEKTDFLKDCTKYGNKDAEQQEKSYSTMMMYEVADLVEDLIDIVKKGGGNERLYKKSKESR